jgi:hypothetical protein
MRAGTRDDRAGAPTMAPASMVMPQSIVAFEPIDAPLPIRVGSTERNQHSDPSTEIRDGYAHRNTCVLRYTECSARRRPTRQFGAGISATAIFGDFYHRRSGLTAFDNSGTHLEKRRSGEYPLDLIEPAQFGGRRQRNFGRLRLTLNLFEC